MGAEQSGEEQEGGGESSIQGKSFLPPFCFYQKHTQTFPKKKKKKKMHRHTKREY